MRDITLGDTLYHIFTTRAFASGVPTLLAGTPVLSVLEENNATPITAGVTVQVDRASVVGLNQATIVATSGNGYETGKTYAIYISTGTVGGVSVVGEVVGQFTIEKSSAFIRLGAPAGASVSADIADVPTVSEFNARTILAASYFDPAADTVVNVTNVAILTGHTAQTGDSFVRIGATGSGLTSLAQASIATEARLAELDAANLPTDIADIPTVAEFNARTLLAASYFDPAADTVALVTNLTNLPSIPANWLTAAGIAASALNGKGDWNIGKTGYSLTQAFPTNFADMAIQVTTGAISLLAATQASIDAIETDTTTDIPALIATAQADLDILTGADGVNLLSATQTSIDAIETDTNSLNDGAIAELSQGVPSATPTLQNAVMLMYMALRNQLDVQTSGTDAFEIHSDDGTQIAIKLLSDSAGDFSEAKMTTGV